MSMRERLELLCPLSVCSVITGSPELMQLLATSGPTFRLTTSTCRCPYGLNRQDPPTLAGSFWPTADGRIVRLLTLRYLATLDGQVISALPAALDIALRPSLAIVETMFIPRNG